MKSLFSDRLPYVSLLRVIAMLLIVIYHSLCFYTGRWWYLSSYSDVVRVWCILSIPVVNIGLTLFVFISGFLFGYHYYKCGKYRNILSFCKGKLRRLIIPYVLWGVIMAAFMPNAFKLENLLTGIAHLWFLLVLFELFIIVLIYNYIISIFEKMNMMKKQMIIDVFIVLLSFISIYVWLYYSTHLYFFGLTNTFYYLPIFLAGYFFAKYDFYKYNKVCIPTLLLFVGFSLFIGLSLFGFKDGDTLYRMPSLFIACSSIIIFRRLFFRYQVPPIINSLDKNSMGIYIFNQFVAFGLLLIPPINMFLSLHPYIGPFIIFSITFIIPWMMSSLCSMNRYLARMI